MLTGLLLLFGAGLWLASGRFRAPYEVNAVTVLECLVVVGLFRGLAVGAWAAAALGWIRRARVESWVASGAWKRAAARAVLAGFMLLVSLLGAEGLLRALHKDPPAKAASALGGAHPVRHHRHAPGLDVVDVAAEWRVRVRTNRLGMRGADPREPRPAFRILVLGDSYTEGYGVEEEETFCALLGRRLGTGVEVLNGGCGSYSPLLEWAALREWGPELKPDLVVLALDCSDIQDDAFYSRFAVFGPDGDLVAVDGTESGRRSQVPDLSRLMDPLKSFRLYVQTRNLFHGAAAWAIRRFGIRVAIPALGDVLVDRLAATRDGTAPRLAPDVARTQGNLRRIRDHCRRLGCPFVLVTYPYAHQVSGREWDLGRIQWGFLPGDVSDPWLMREMAAFGAREGFPVIDLTEDFRRSADFPLYYAKDGHWTAKGHVLAAEGIARELLRLGVVPRP